MIMPVWLMWLIPPAVFMIIPLKMLIDWFAIYLPLDKKYSRKEITVKASWKIWLTDIGLHLAAVGIMYAALYIDPLFRSNPTSFDDVKEISNATPDWIVAFFEGILANPFNSIYSIIFVLILFAVIILVQFKLTGKIYSKFGLDEKQIAKSSMISALLMAPWIIIIPTSLFSSII
ncbi:hypothetical protein GCM10007275_20400 [Jeotgalicoccus coquinae]|uniref:Uncharacterized protein n=1 Tax=Jeotgalicoccus coquinae TaxID=709509 RepID=A0A6V7RRA3_9STAP|nr:hypothetical protein [Jeotgalicoccus coquinae]MBB6424256.1 hypothetical protein [Jeotgalicoccus coquinae]GGE25243.1 hypothetical protein GCM10007275_20400 [Jeotgalicoccus coquinae]CAD2081601.1 hypothetical protein JEOCOQ751_02047 [Jeotgalicoccus coquinae]